MKTFMHVKIKDLFQIKLSSPVRFEIGWSFSLASSSMELAIKYKNKSQTATACRAACRQDPSAGGGHLGSAPSGPSRHRGRVPLGSSSKFSFVYLMAKSAPKLLSSSICWCWLSRPPSTSRRLALPASSHQEQHCAMKIQSNTQLQLN